MMQVSSGGAAERVEEGNRHIEGRPSIHPSSELSGVDFVREMSGEIQSYFLQLQNAFDSTGSVFPPDGSSAALWACLWTGWVTCAYTIYAQSFGQRRVNAAAANLIYTMQPIFSSLFAYFLLGESLGVFGFGGASLIFFALWVVTSSNQSSDESEE